MRGFIAAVGAALACVAAATSPVPGFRPPSVPIFLQSPEVNVWSPADNLNDMSPQHWTGANLDLFSAVRVDGTPYLLMGAPTTQWSAQPLATATQTSLMVYATQTRYSFSAGPVAINLTFTSPLITSDYELLSRPAHYVTFDVAATDAGTHNVQFYFDITGNVVVRDPSADVSWGRVAVTGVGIDSSVTALRIGATQQNPLVDTNDRPSWGVAYLVADTSAAAGASTVLEYGNTTRSLFWGTGTLPQNDNTNQPAPLLPPGPLTPPTGPQVGVDRSGDDLPGYPITLKSADYNLCYALCNQTAACKAWAYAIPNCDGYAQPTCWLKGDFPATEQQSCRVSGAQAQPSYSGTGVAAAVVYDLGTTVTAAGASRMLTFAVDELLALSWFGEQCPPYWRRNLPLNDTTTVPMDMLAEAWGSYAAAKQLCNDFDAQTATLLSTAGGDEYATIAQLTYRQVFGAMTLVWIPSKQAPWYFLKEISSCGCLNTADVVYPAFPQVLYYSPELMRTMMISHLEYAMNYTNQPYPLPWAPHHLGYWPIADLPYTQQENMPLEESAWDLLILAAIAQRQGGDVTWMEPYWPAIQQWYEFLITLMPFPGTQLSTDDFDGQLYNATNLALKGVASIAAYGYLVTKYTGNASAGEEAYATAASYAATMVQYAWNSNGTDSHFMIGYAGSQGDGGEPGSWPMLYNALWLRLLGFTDLLPTQDTYLNAQRDWYAANVMEEFGIPLNSRKLFTKDDWMTFLAAFYYDNSAVPQPSPFSNTLFNGLFNFANTTTSREALSDWTNTDQPTAVGFTARPVYGAMYAPVLVQQAASLGLGDLADPAVARANEVFRRVHAERAVAELEAARAAPAAAFE